MAVTFYLNTSNFMSLPGRVAAHLFTALAYDPDEVENLKELPLEDVLGRITILRRQLALGHGAEFTSAEVDQSLLSHYCDYLEGLVGRDAGTQLILL